MRFQDRSLFHHIEVYPQVYAHHNEKEHQVGHGPEDQVAPAKDRSQFGAQVQVTDTVPAQTRHGPHEYRYTPHKGNQQGHSTFGEITVDLPFHDGDVALQGDHQEVGQGSGETRIQQTLPKEVGLNR